MKVAVISFPGSNCDLDTLYVLKELLGVEADLLWHESADLVEYDGAILPGGFSYGDHLRAGLIAAYSPVMKQIRAMAEEGLPILGICNGFQILVESGLLPGALLRNIGLKFVCRWTKIRVETDRTAFTIDCLKGDILHMPIAHNEGYYFIDQDQLAELHLRDQIVFSYVDSNPNGSVENIAGVCNEEGNVVGLMPHPERASETILSPFESQDGLRILQSMITYLGKC